MAREELEVPAGNPLALPLKDLSYFSALRGAVSLLGLNLSPDPVPGTSRLGLRGFSCQVDKASLSKVVSIYRAGVAVRSPLEVGVGYLISLYPFVCRGPSDGDRSIKIFSSCMTPLVSARRGPG